MLVTSIYVFQVLINLQKFVKKLFQAYCYGETEDFRVYYKLKKSPLELLIKYQNARDIVKPGADIEYTKEDVMEKPKKWNKENPKEFVCYTFEYF